MGMLFRRRQDHLTLVLRSGRESPRVGVKACTMVLERKGRVAEREDPDNPGPPVRIKFPLLVHLTADRVT